MSFLLGRIKGGAISKCVGKGHHGCVGQRGTTRIPVALFTVTFLNTFYIMQKGGKHRSRNLSTLNEKHQLHMLPGQVDRRHFFAFVINP